MLVLKYHLIAVEYISLCYKIMKHDMRINMHNSQTSPITKITYFWESDDEATNSLRK